MNYKCPLCSNNSDFYISFRDRDYFKCEFCLSVFVDPYNLLSKEDEKLRYLEHNNDIFDPGYRTFVSPIIEVVRNNFSPKHIGLDFGSGTGPVISQILFEEGYRIEQYDPFFYYNSEVLSKKYDYIVCCEVIEHFHNPRKEFMQLRSMINEGGELVCMTDLLTDKVDFAKWYYKNDPTHTFFYHTNSLNYIQSEFQFRESNLNNRTIRFSV